MEGGRNLYPDQYDLIRDEVQKREYWVLGEETILRDARKQRRFFYRVFPRWPDDDQSGPETFEWILSLICDGSGAAEPRELIHILTVARNVQLRKLEVGQYQPPGEVLFDIAALREALPEVSRVRVQQTLFAEYPQCRDWIEILAGERRVPLEYSSSMLASIWNVSQHEANRRAERLVNIGFFALQGSKRRPSYVLPELHRAALGRS